MKDILNPFLRGFPTEYHKLRIVGYLGAAAIPVELPFAIFVQSLVVSDQDLTPTGLDFNNDGSKLYMCGTQNSSIYQYNLSIDFDISQSGIQSFSVSDEDLSPSCVIFNNDGSKMYVVGNQTNTIYEYNLSINFDITSATILQSFDVSNEDTTPTEMDFNNDGSKMFLLGNATNSIYEYDLSPNFDITSASISKSFSVATEDNDPSGMDWNDDGSILYITGVENSSVFQYHLSTDFDVLSAGIKSFDVSFQDTVPHGITFNNDGSKMYMIGSGNDRIHEYNLSTSFDVTSATIFQSIGVASEDVSPQGMAFNNDGSKMYVVGNATNSIYEYNLSTSFDVRSSDIFESLDISNEDVNPTGMAFNNDGSKMYVVGNQTKNVYEYNLSPNFDISQATITKSFSVITQDGEPQGITFNNDGSKMYVVGNQTNTIYEYNLSTSFDVTSAEISKSFPVGTEDDDPNGMAWNNDGSKMYMVGITTDTIYEYNLSTDFNISQAGIQSFSVSTQDSTPLGVDFNNDGSKMYVAGNANDSIFEYDLTSNFDITSASFLQLLDVSDQDNSPTDIAWNDDGSKMYVMGNSTNSIYQYHLSIDFDISQAGIQTLSIFTQDPGPTSVTFNDDGSRMYMLGNFTDKVFQYDLTTNFDITSATFDGSFSISSETSPESVTFNNDGSKMYVLGDDADLVVEYNLSTNFDVTTAALSGSTFDFSIQTQDPRGMAWNSDGSKLFIAGNDVNAVIGYNLSNNFDVSQAGIKSFDVSSQDAVPQGVTFNNDGSKMYMIGSGNDSVYEYDLTSNFNVTTASINQTLPVSTQDTAPTDITFNNDGSKMYVTGNQNDSVYEYNLSPNFDISSASISLTLDISDQETSPTGMAWNNDGSKMYIVGTNSDSVHEYTLSPNYKIDTASFSQSFSVVTQDANPTGIKFNDDGSRMYVVGSSSDSVHEYTLPNNYDIDIVSFSQTLDISDQDGNPLGMAWNNDGSKMYIVGNANDNIYEFNLSTNYDISTAVIISFSVGAQDTTPTGITFNNVDSKMYITGNVNNSIYEYNLL